MAKTVIQYLVDVATSKPRKVLILPSPFMEHGCRPRTNQALCVSSASDCIHQLALLQSYSKRAKLYSTAFLWKNWLSATFRRKHFPSLRRAGVFPWRKWGRCCTNFCWLPSDIFLFSQNCRNESSSTPIAEENLCKWTVSSLQVCY